MLVELLRESILIQALITLVLVTSASIMSVYGQQPPEWMVQAVMLVLGFYFGSKVERAIARAQRQ